jgi:hypothetical protein
MAFMAATFRGLAPSGKTMRGPGAEEPACAGDGLAVVASRRRDDSPAAFFLAKIGQQVDAAPGLESAQGQMLVVF